MQFILIKATQVQLMSRIYQQATGVLAYLGEASEDSDIGLDFILEHEKALGSAIPPSLGLGPGVFSSPQQKSVDNILERPYFERIWVIQEIVLAKEVYDSSGQQVRFLEFTVFAPGRRIDWNKKAYLGTQYRKKPPSLLSYCDISRMNPESKRKFSSEDQESLLGLLRSTRNLKATDPRDKLFALLGLSTEENKQELLPDYSLSVRETFIKAAKFFIQRNKKLDILCHSQGGRSAHNLPSWVPDWSFPLPSNVLGHTKKLQTSYRASSGASPNFSFEQNTDALIVEGKLVDKVAEIELIYEMGADNCKDCFKKWEAMLLARNSGITMEESLGEFMKTIAAYSTDGIPYVIKTWYAAWRRVILDGQPPEADGIHVAGITVCQENVNDACNGRVFFVTEKGYWGLGPAEVQKSYQVVVLLGGSVPFILSQDKESYRLMGECYTRGIMNGEVLQDDGMESIMFRIL